MFTQFLTDTRTCPKKNAAVSICEWFDALSLSLSLSLTHTHTTVCQKKYAPDKKMPKLKIHVKNPVPFGRGLGSSATAIVGGMCSGFRV